jgi:glutaredoxin
MAKLFLLKPDFIDKNIDNRTKFYCPHCAMINGVINYYPKLKEEIEIIYVDFERPRNQLIELVGEENQSCPNLVINKNEIDGKTDVSYFNSYGEYLFVDDEFLISRYLSEKYKIGVAH